MDFVTVEQLSDDHLRTYSSVFAHDAIENRSLRVWASRRLIPFVSAESPGTERKSLYARVQSLTDEGISPLVERLSTLDPSAQHLPDNDLVCDDE